MTAHPCITSFGLHHNGFRRKLLFDSSNVERLFAASDKLNVRHVGMLLALEKRIDLFERLAFRFDPVDSLDTG